VALAEGPHLFALDVESAGFVVFGEERYRAQVKPRPRPPPLGAA
jgi:hypothetical protein